MIKYTQYGIMQNIRKHRITNVMISLPFELYLHERHAHVVFRQVAVADTV